MAYPRRGGPAAAARDELAAVERRLETLRIPYEEWEILFRQILLVERAVHRVEAERTGEGDGAQPQRRLLATVAGRLARAAERVVIAALEGGEVH